jgi:hypothetical protein
MKNLKLLSCLFLIVFTVSCKKNEIVKEPSFEEMKAIMSSSPELNQAFKLDNDISIIRQAALYKNLNNKRNGLKTESTSNINTNNLKNEADFINILDKHYDNRGKDILIKIKSQLESIKQFGEKNPEFNKFSEDQRKELLNLSLIAYKKNLDLSKKMLLTNNSELEIKISENCMSSFNTAYYRCHRNHDIETIILWAGVAYSGGSAFGGGLIGQLGIEIIYMLCINDATVDYEDCFNDAVILP